MKNIITYCILQELFFASNMSEDNSRFHGGQKRPVNGMKRVAFSVQLSSLLDQWSPDTKVQGGLGEGHEISLVYIKPKI